ncbi:hypothetical protein E2562_001044 [Oryza meyeriana var. granulata]|uniref:Uncharacterized protein n=1 Tax=Oryza meyeriana var. granulata TaxID=110450 RepID=A0A6G1ECX6_9ORYZ|nr:hypothetical protein E2562_001044 [Oryza meyeriana var. granulata]
MVEGSAGVEARAWHIPRDRGRETVEEAQGGDGCGGGVRPFRADVVEGSACVEARAWRVPHDRGRETASADGGGGGGRMRRARIEAAEVDGCVMLLRVWGIEAIARAWIPAQCERGSGAVRAWMEEPEVEGCAMHVVRGSGAMPARMDGIK